MIWWTKFQKRDRVI